ncbi:MAG: cytochrome P450 [Hyphomonadaceae bacterium]
MRVSFSDLDIVGPEAIRDPHGYFGRVRDAAPVVWDERARSWLVTSYEMVTRALLDDHFSSDRIRPFIAKKLSAPDSDPLVRQAFDVLSNWLVFNDAPIHPRLRMLINHAFMSKTMLRLNSRFETLCDEILSSAPNEGAFDLLDTVSTPFSASVISELLGVPHQDRERFERWQRLFGPIIGASLGDSNKYDSLAEGVDELLRYVRTLIVRQQEQPQENLLNELIKAKDQDGALSEAEVLATCTLVIFAGSETTANLIANSMSALLRFPDQMQRLRDKDVDIHRAVEEFLRFDGSGKAVTRVVKADTDVLGVEMKAGERVFCILAAANHDPAVFEQPDELILDRAGDRKHIAFGYGAHNCLGSRLARLETAIAIPKMLEKWRRIELAGEREWYPQLLSRGLLALPVRVAA